MPILADPVRLHEVREWAAHDVDTFTQFAGTMSACGIDVLQARVLDIGCGSNAPVTLLLKGRGARVTGIDYEIGHRWGLGFRPSRYTSYLREAGLARTVRKAVGELVYDRIYYQTLRERSGIRISEHELDLREMPVTDLAFPDNHFDAIHSNAVWEHIIDVPRANAELARVLKPNGVAYIEIHLFPSISGGHDLPWIVANGHLELGDVPPWRHLRDPQWEPPRMERSDRDEGERVPLNRWKESDYRAAFEATAGLCVERWLTEYTEGESLLTEAIREELPQYTARDLTTRSIIAVLRKRA